MNQKPVNPTIYGLFDFIPYQNKSIKSEVNVTKKVTTLIYLHLVTVTPVTLVNTGFNSF